MKMFKHKRNKDNNINSHFLITSFLGLIICATCLCLTTYAWFTSTINTSVSSINTPTYVLYYSVGENEKVELSYKEGEYTTYTPDTNDSISITLSTGENDNGTGYCLIKIGDDTYYTSLITKDSSYTFNVTNAKDKTITFIPCWGNIEKDESYKGMGESGITFEANAVTNEEQEEAVDEKQNNESNNDTSKADETEVEKEQESTEETKDLYTSAEGTDEDSSKENNDNKTEVSDGEGEDVKQEEAEGNTEEASGVDESLATETASTSEVI